MNLTSLEYHGDVSVDLVIRDKVISIKGNNAGKPALLRLFAKAVTGNKLQVSDLPTFVDLLFSTDGKITWNSYLTLNIVISEKYFNLDNVSYSTESWIATFTAVILFLSLRQAIDAQTSNAFKLVMFTGYNNLGVREGLAELEVDAVDLAKIIPGTSAIIKWNMRVINPIQAES